MAAYRILGVAELMYDVATAAYATRKLRGRQILFKTGQNFNNKIGLGFTIAQTSIEYVVEQDVEAGNDE